MLVFVIDYKVLPCVEDYLRAITKDGSIHVTYWQNLIIPLNCKRIVFVQKLPPKHLTKNFQKKMYSFALLNIEQLTRESVLNGLYKDLERDDININILLDYSPANARLVSHRSIKHHITIPFPPVGPPFVPPSEPEKCVAFVGFLSPRRRYILDQLRDNGIKVLHIKAWGNERDQIISKCKILINVHYAPDYNVFESFRCVPWILQRRMKVISEASFDMESEWAYPFVIWCPYTELITSVKAYI